MATFKTHSDVAGRAGNFSYQPRFNQSGGKSFSTEIGEWVEATGLKIETAIKKIVIDIFSKVILRTPVDTGRARANWVVGLNGPNQMLASSTEVDKGRVDPTGMARSKAKTRMIQWVRGANVETTKSYFLTNNVVYAIRLEYGWSRKQAPSGMVRVTLREYRKIVQRITEEVKKGSLRVRE